MATAASTSAPAKVESAGTRSSAPERTMISATKVAMSENSASRSDEAASRDTGSSIIRRRAMASGFPLGFRHSRSVAQMA